MARKKRNNPDEENNVIGTYLKEINNIPLLSREEEDSYVKQYQKTKDEYSRKTLINANLKFVVNVAKRYQNQGLPLQDLISEGNIGLINAIERYDVERGYHFISYAVWWIRQSILKAVSEKSRMIQLPLNKANELVQIEKVKEELTKKYSHEPDIKDIAKYLDMDESHVSKLIKISIEPVSLETPVYVEKDPVPLKEFISSGQYSPEKDLINNDLKENINNALKTLTEREAKIIEYRFGLNGKKPMSLKQIGELYNLSKERIRQIEKKAMKRLKHPSRSENLKIYLKD